MLAYKQGGSLMFYVRTTAATSQRFQECYCVKFPILQIDCQSPCKAWIIDSISVCCTSCIFINYGGECMLSFYSAAFIWRRFCTCLAHLPGMTGSSLLASYRYLNKKSHRCLHCETGHGVRMILNFLKLYILSWKVIKELWFYVIKGWCFSSAC